MKRSDSQLNLFPHYTIDYRRLSSSENHRAQRKSELRSRHIFVLIALKSAGGECLFNSLFPIFENTAKSRRNQWAALTETIKMLEETLDPDVLCSVCAGTGAVDSGMVCLACNGKGRVSLVVRYEKHGDTYVGLTDFGNEVVMKIDNVDFVMESLPIVLALITLLPIALLAAMREVYNLKILVMILVTFLSTIYGMKLLKHLRGETLKVS